MKLKITLELEGNPGETSRQIIESMMLHCEMMDWDVPFVKYDELPEEDEDEEEYENV